MDWRFCKQNHIYERRQRGSSTWCSQYSILTHCDPESLDWSTSQQNSDRECCKPCKSMAALREVSTDFPLRRAIPQLTVAMESVWKPRAALKNNPTFKFRSKILGQE
ncbi:hypothetical protein MTO96_000818 [Rhipicephalus appendiculatus]